jgi:hypothetical protein
MAEPIKSIFDLPQYQHLRDKFDKRRSRFRRYWKYYKSDYPQTFGQFNSAPGQYIQQMLANAIKPLFTPLARAVNIDVALVPGKWALLPETPDAQRQALARLFKASRWPTEGDLWVRYGTALGETGLRIVDDRMAKRVMAQPVAPWTYVYEPGSPFDTTPALAIFIRIEKEKNERGQWVDVEYAEVMTPQTISTYRNGQPQAGGGRPQTYTNALEMVPLVVALHDCGDGQPESTFDDTITALDQVNAQATYMAKIIERHAEPQWAVFGAEAGDLEKDGESIWFFPEGSSVEAILAQVDFDGLLHFVQEIKQEMKDSLPELAFSKLVGVERVAAATIELQMSEAVFKIKRLRKTYDEALANTAHLVGRAAQQMGLADLSPLAEELAFDPERPVITIDALTQLQIEQARSSADLTAQALERERQLMAMANGDGS